MGFPCLDSLNESRFSNNINHICSNLSLLFLLLFFVDFLCLGSGQLTEIAYAISTREIFFTLTFLFSLPILFARKKEIGVNLIFGFLVLFLVVVAVNAVRGGLAGNDLAIIKSDILGYLNLMLFPVACAVLYSRPRLELLLKLIIAVCALWAFCSLVLSYYAFYNPVFAMKFSGFLNDHGICSLSLMGERGTRVFFHTASRWMFPAFLFATYFAVVQKRHRVFYMTAMILFEASLAIAYSRAFYLGVMICAVLLLIFTAVFFRQHFKGLLMVWGIAVICGVLVLGAISTSQHFNIFKAMLARTEIAGNLSTGNGPSQPSANSGVGDASDGVGEENGSDAVVPDPEISPPEGEHFNSAQDDYLNIQAELDSNAERAAKIKQISALIAKNPFFGNGLGARVAYGNGYVEYFYHDLLAKMGIWGLFCFLLPLFYGATLLFRSGQYRKTAFPWIFFVAIVYFLVISYFNPCLNSVTGLSLYILFLTVCYLAHSNGKIITDGV